MRWFLRLPLFVVLMGLGAGAMILPALFGLAVRDYATARIFLYTALLLIGLTGLVGLATQRPPGPTRPHNQLLALVAAFVFLPVMLAAPVVQAVHDTTLLNAYFEMLSSLTTTGATVFETQDRLPDAVHLWRVLVGWLGGALMWIAAIAVLAPVDLGGYEVTARLSGARSLQNQQIQRIADPAERLISFALAFAPIYGFLTMLLWVILILTGQPPFLAISYAMSTLATSGILPVTHTLDLGFPSEVAIFLFFYFALSRRTFSTDQRRDNLPIFQDPEIRLAVIILLVLPLLLFLRHWIGASEVAEGEDLRSAARALWGSLFSVASFLTTTGFESADWQLARNWSGLRTPGLILMGLAILGGGVATTAGGIKLLRVFALYKHGLREIERLVHPSSVGGSGLNARQIRRQGAQIAWIFFMLFAMSLAAITTALALSGLTFEAAISLSIAGLTNTGPIALIALDRPISYAVLPDMAKIVLMVAMVMGRLEMLAIIALLNPNLWRR